MPRVSPEATIAAAVELEDGGILPNERPAPPDRLSDDEKELWVQVVDNYPPHYFSVETQPLLEALVGHCFMMRRIMAEVRKPISKSEFKEWSQLFCEHTNEAGKLASKLRLTQMCHIAVSTATKMKTARTMPVAPKSTKAWDVIRN